MSNFKFHPFDKLRTRISNFKLLAFCYLFTTIVLFFYSFTQVDLNLTLSQASWWQVTQKFFQHIGYFQRPLSSLIYVILIALFFGFYFIFIKLSKENKISTKQLWILILITAGILSFSYNAFSYDLFNYMFDAKIVTFYHQNPYVHKALDYLGDPMLNFMRWTHRPYPYGPTWLFMTVPLSYVGLNFFLPTFFLFKIFNSLYFLGAAYFIGKILKKLKKNYILGIIIFAFNPLVLIESLVSSHNDTAMMFLAVLSVYFLLTNKKVLSVTSIVASIGVKFATVFMLPSYVYYLLKSKSSSFKIETFLNLLFISMFIPLIFVTVRTNFQPWYLLYIIPFASLIPEKKYAYASCIILPFFALLQYLPFIYKGDWNDPVPQILFRLTISGAVLYAGYSIFSGKLKRLQIFRKK